jgi:hypothetical protein
MKKYLYVFISLIILLNIITFKTSYASNNQATTLKEVKLRLNNFFERIAINISTASKELGSLDLTGKETRRILSGLSKIDLCIVDCSIVSSYGKMITIEPSSYKKLEGSDISKQEQVIYVQNTKKPIMSSLINTVEGMKAIDIEYPIFTAKKKFRGSVSILFRQDKLLSSQVTPILVGTPYELTVLQKNGIILYNSNKKNIGKDVFTVPDNRKSADYYSLLKKILTKTKGEQTYITINNNSKKTVKKRVVWDTVSFYRADWRIVITEK